MNKKIPFVVFTSIAISFLLVYLVNDNYRSNSDIEKWEYLFYSQDFDEKERGYLIGSSMTVRINQTHIEKVLQENGQNIEIYNLGKPQDFPSERIQSLDSIINSKPKFVVYTIGYRDLKLVDEMPEGEGPRVIPTGKFTELNNFKLGDWSLNKLNFGVDLDNFKNPKLTTLQIIDQVGKKKIDPPIIKDPKHPFQYQIGKPILSEKEMNEKYHKINYRKNMFPEGKNGVALEKIVSELTSNEIKVFLHLAPYHELYRNVIPEEDEKKYITYTNNLSKKYGVIIIDHHLKYSDLEIWNDFRHIAFHEKSIQYYEDIANEILKGI